MGYDISNDKGNSTGFNTPMWAELRWIGENWGWKPCGTYLLKDDDAFYDNNIIEAGEYYGPYTGNNGQVVTAEDASAWSQALEQALADPELSVKLEKMHNNKITEYKSYSEESNVEMALWEYDENLYINTIQGFIEFCNNGAFVIS